MPEGRMRCSANGASLRHKATFFALKTVPQAEPTPHQSANADSCLAAARAGAGLGSHREPIQYRAPASQPSRGSQSKGRAARLDKRTVFARTRKLSPLCTLSLSVTAPGLPVPRGVSGGGAALSSLCRRFPGGDIMNLTSRRNPLSGLSFSLFFFLRERKRGYWRRRSHKISVTKAKTA